jgi:hypothetical protein
MGQSALTDKTYHFDKVFSSAADQSMLYDEVVTPILDEVSHISALKVFCGLFIFADDCRIQLHHIRLRTDRNRKDIYHVR